MKKTAIFEDTTMAYNKWMKDVAARDLGTSKVDIQDLMTDGQSKGGNPNRIKPVKTRHPLLDQAPEIVGQILLNLSNLKQKLSIALNSNLAEKDHNKEALKRLLIRTKKNMENVKGYISDFERLS